MSISVTKHARPPSPVGLYQVLGQSWLAMPWSVVVVLGTATSFTVGFTSVPCSHDKSFGLDKAQLA